MSDLGFLERLLDGAAVEWVPLGEVTQYEQPTKYLVSSSNYSDQFSTPVLTAGKTFVLGYTDETHGIYPAKSSPTIIFDDFTTANKWVDFDFKAKSSAMKMITSRDDRRFLLKYTYYWLNTLPNEQADADHKRHWISNFCNKTIPIPCPDDPQKSLAIQAEIVRILDAFTALTAELTARKTQYNHYRNQLLSFEGGDVALFALGDPRVGVFTRGGGLQKKDFVDRGVPCIHYGQIYTHYGTFADKTKSFVTEDFAKRARKAKPGDLVIATTSENDDDVCKAVAWLGEEDVAVSSDACFYTHNLNPKYVSYFFQTEQFQKQKRVHITGTKVRRVNADDLAKILIPIPFPNDPEKSLAEQTRIATILDKFDTLTTSLAEGLPREIALRKRQYEHYRNLLLGFPTGDKA